MAKPKVPVVPVVWSDLSDRLIADAHASLLLVLNSDSVKVSVMNILGTRKGERIFLPQFGSDIGNVLFEPIGSATADQLSQNVKIAIETWDNRVNVQGVDTQIDPDKNSVSITVRFSILSYSQIFNSTLTLTS